MGGHKWVGGRERRVQGQEGGRAQEEGAGMRGVDVRGRARVWRGRWGHMEAAR